MKTTNERKELKKYRQIFVSDHLKFNVDADKIMNMVVFRENFAHADNPG